MVFLFLHHSLLRESAGRGHALYASNTMGSGSATNDLTSPSSASSPRFNEPEALSFERPTLQVLPRQRQLASSQRDR